jgi:osmotically-inducible protein OsmY
LAAIGAGAAAGVAATKDQTFGESVDDAATSNEIKTRLLRESRRRFAEVDVEVNRGLVLLSGRVNKPEDRVEAEGLAWDSKGTQDVANEIQIEAPGGFLANVSDEIISGRVRARLVGSSAVKAVNFNVETYNGVVYLMGVARSAEELKRAAEEASVVGGVRQVVSYVRVREPAPIRGPQTKPEAGLAPADIAPGGFENSAPELTPADEETAAGDSL